MNKSMGCHPLLAVVLLSLLMSSGVCFAGPGLLNYQGRLTDGKGNPVTYTVTITFTFWNAESAGEILAGFSDSDTVTPDRDGIYSTLVGDDPGNLIPESVFERKGVWLNVNVNAEDLRPRKRLTSVGYSVQSETVQGAEVGRMSFKAAEDVKEMLRSETCLPLRPSGEMSLYTPPRPARTSNTTFPSGPSASR